MSKVSYTLCIQWLPVFSRYYPLKGISPVFFQNVLELLFLVGFVWYLNWSPLLVWCYCVVEVFFLWLFSVLKSKTSMGWLEYRQVSLFMVTGGLIGLLSGVSSFLLWKINASLFSVHFFIQFIWNDHEFLLCLLAILLQQVLAFYKHKKMLLHRPFDRMDTFVNPVFRILIQQLLLIIAVVFFWLVPPVDVLCQAVVMTCVWTISKTIVSQMHVVVEPVHKG